METSKYVVYLTMYSGNRLPKWYIGSTNINRIIYENYNGSVLSKKYSKIWKEERLLHPDLFKTRVLSYHNNTFSALSEELRLQKLHMVVTNNKYVNMAYATVNGFFGRDVSGENHPRYGKKMSKESLIKRLNTLNTPSSDGITPLERSTHKSMATMATEEWQNTIGLEMKQKMRDVKSDEAWKLKFQNVFKIAGEKRSKVRATTEWKHTVGKEAANKRSIRMQDPEWQNTTGVEMKNKMRATKSTEEWKKNNSGENFYRTKKIEIYDNMDNLIFVSVGSFTKFCNDNGLPCGAFKLSYKNNTKLYNTNNTKSRAINNGLERFIGWYAILGV